MTVTVPVLSITVAADAAGSPPSVKVRVLITAKMSAEPAAVFALEVRMVESS